MRYLATFFALIGAAGIAAAQSPTSYMPIAECAWRTAPHSSVFWMNMETPQRMDSFDSAAVLLGHRLIALCAQRAQSEPNFPPDWRRLRIAMQSQMPRSVSGQDPDTPITKVCRNYVGEGEERSLFSVTIVRVEADRETTMFEQQYVTTGAGMVDHLGREAQIIAGSQAGSAEGMQLPQGLTTSPLGGMELATECGMIRSDGSVAADGEAPEATE